ncbi:Reticulon-like protein [Dirofilaria immitis]|nr:Reticulon-like protein [Dirofilaria immitis]
MEPVSKLYPEYRSSASPTAPMNVGANYKTFLSFSNYYHDFRCIGKRVGFEPAVSSPPGITAASLITTKQLMSQKLVAMTHMTSSDGSSNEFVKVEHSDVQRSAGLTDNTLPFGMLQLHNDENDKRKDDRKNFENIMDHGFESEEQYSRILPRAEEFAESAFEKMSDVAQAGECYCITNIYCLAGDLTKGAEIDSSRIVGEVSGDTINLFSDKMKETAEQTRDMGHQAMETVKDTASDMLSGAVHGISNLSEKVHNVGADITHSLDEAYDAGSHSAFHQPMHDVQQNADDPSQQWGMDWRQYADEAANIDVRHSDLETDVKAVQSTGSTIRDEIINAHDQVDSLIANMFTSSTPQHHGKLNHVNGIMFLHSYDSSAEESMFDRKGPLTIPHQIPEDMIQLDRDFDSPKQGGFEVSPRPPTPPKELDDEDVKPTTIDLGQTGVVAGEHPSSILKHNPQILQLIDKTISGSLGKRHQRFSEKRKSDVIIAVVVASAATAATVTAIALLLLLLLLLLLILLAVLNGRLAAAEQQQQQRKSAAVAAVVVVTTAIAKRTCIASYPSHSSLSMSRYSAGNWNFNRFDGYCEVDPLVIMANSKADSSSIFDTVFSAVYALISLTVRTILRFGLTAGLIASVVITLHDAGQFSRRTFSQRQDVLDVIYWRDPKKSGAILLVTLSALLILANFPLIAIFSYVGLSILGGTLGFRIYKLVEAQIKKTDGRNPYGSYLNQEFHLPKEKVHQQVDALIEHVQFIVNKLRRLFLVESIMDSVKFGLLLWALTYVSCWFSGLSLLILALLAVFTIPKVYEVYQEPIDRNMSIAKQHVGNVNTIIGEKIPFLKKSADSHEKSN